MHPAVIGTSFACWATATNHSRLAGRITPWVVVCSVWPRLDVQNVLALSGTKEGVDDCVTDHHV